MIFGFPLKLVSAVRCTSDGAPLHHDGIGGTDELLSGGTLRCRECHSSFPIEDGVLNMLNDKTLDTESRHEQHLRDTSAGSGVLGLPAWYEDDHNSAEIIPTIDALSLKKNSRLLELGCGDGRYTISLHDRCASLLAVDFSRESLRILRQRLPDSSTVGLVLADITKLRLTDGFFNAILSTLVSNLPTPGHRQAMYRICSRALDAGGRFVFSTHNFGIRQKFSGLQQSGRYTPGGIYRYFFTTGELLSEVQPFFRRVHVRPIQAYLPFVRRIRMPLRAQSRILERIPILSNLGELLLCTSTEPLA